VRQPVLVRPLQRLVQVRGLFGEHVDDLVPVAVSRGAGYAVVVGQRVRRGAVAEPAHAQHRLAEAAQGPAAARGAAPPPVGCQQPGDELHRFPGDVEPGTIADHVEPSGEGDLVVRPLLPGLHAHLRAALFVRVSASTSSPGQEKARLSEPISLRSPQ
jgi:hypothetical protein